MNFTNPPHLLNPDLCKVFLTVQRGMGGWHIRSCCKIFSAKMTAFNRIRFVPWHRLNCLLNLFFCVCVFLMVFQSWTEKSIPFFVSASCYVISYLIFACRIEVISYSKMIMSCLFPKQASCFSIIRPQLQPSQRVKVTLTHGWWSFPKQTKDWASMLWVAKSRIHPSTFHASSRGEWPRDMEAWSEGTSCCLSTEWYVMTASVQQNEQKILSKWIT